MVAFVSTFLMTIIGVAICLWVGARRPLGTPVTWGEAFVGGTFVFAIMVLAYGVVPHQWLDWADNELGWRPDKLLVAFSADGVKFNEAAGDLGGRGRIIVSYETLRDFVAAGLYVVFLGGQMVLWSMWQKRGRAKAAIEPTSRFGRPVIRPPSTRPVSTRPVSTRKV